ncbi:MAG: RsmE family RNA methyltransferase [Acidimicrobiia bacterium]
MGTPLTPVTPLTARAHVFVADLDRPALGDDDRHHLRRVLRLREGAEVTACDGRGGWRPCRLGRSPELEPVGDVVVDPAPAPPLTVAFAVVKGERPEMVVQKLTEVGIDRIVPFVSDRSIVRWDRAKAERHGERWSAIARQAAMQCRRTRIPAVSAVETFARVAGLDGAALADLSGEPLTPRTRTVLVGPEGGWSDDERAVGLPTVRLGSHVLRAETAAITAGGLLVALRGGLVRSAQR